MDITSIKEILQEVYDGNIPLIIILVVLLGYSNRSNLYELYETYVVGKLLKNNNTNILNHGKDSEHGERNNKKYISNQSNENYDKILKVIDELKSEITIIKKQQETISSSQDSSRAELESLINDLAETKETMNKICDNQEFLMMADKEDKKAYITREYNYFFIRLKKIDLYSRENLEKIYDIYLKENGDTFVAGMMSAIRSLQVVPQLTAEEIEDNR